MSGSTLIEITVAATIIVILFALVSTFVVKLWASMPSDRQTLAHGLLMKYIQSPNDEQETDQLPKNWKLEIHKAPYRSMTDVQEWHWEIKDQETGEILDQMITLKRDTTHATSIF